MNEEPGGPDPVDGSEPTSAAAPSPRPVELALARVHLRLGSLALARAELEILNDRGGLDLPGQVDLAEVRWRTGSLTEAGEAAASALDAGEDQPVALIIAAEAAAALGRPTEARRLAGMAMERLDGPLDGLFAGMPRSGVWPADATESRPIADTLFPRESAAGRNLRAGDMDPAVAADRAPEPESSNDPILSGPSTVGFWDSDDEPGALQTALPNPADELQAARAALVAGYLDEAMLRFALALRLAPALAPSILEATIGVPGPSVDLLRGDAYRMLGLEPEAVRAYASAAWSGERDRRNKPKPAQRLTARRGPRRAAEVKPQAAEVKPQARAVDDADATPGPTPDPSVPSDTIPRRPAPRRQGPHVRH